MTPLERVSSIKVKLGLLVAASALVAAVVASVGRITGVSAVDLDPGHDRDRARGHPAAGGRDDVPAAADDRRGPADGPG